MSTRQILSVPVHDDLGTAIRRAAHKEKLTVAAWMRSRALDALQGPAPARGPFAASLGRIPRAWTAAEAGTLLDLRPGTIARKLRAGQLAGYLDWRTVYDPGRHRWLQRRRWMIPAPALFAYMDERVAYEWEHGRRPYTRRPADTPRPATPFADPSHARRTLRPCVVRRAPA